mmetsp:Transcript_35541/g.74882  ORF Transcript_35541/g.74882 Transcript_35541/m.74882 type:complete len:103 (-) Transcript_35541:402-710(-)
MKFPMRRRNHFFNGNICRFINVSIFTIIVCTPSSEVKPARRRWCGKRVDIHAFISKSAISIEEMNACVLDTIRNPSLRKSSSLELDKSFHRKLLASDSAVER